MTDLADDIRNETPAAIVPIEVPKPSTDTIPLAKRGIVIDNITDLMRFASTCVRSGLAPFGIDTPEKAFVAVEYGMELGLRPMQALKRVAVING